MKNYTELARLSQQVAAELVLAYHDPESRDSLVQAAITPLDLAETMQVTGMVISQLCDLLDGILKGSTEARRLADEGMQSILDRLASSDGIVE